MDRAECFPSTAFGNEKHYARQQVDAFAAKIPEGWLVVTVLINYF
ncbi:MAG TPA: hypothetical protein VGM03_18840 [Phycisphaerae bacterium]